MPNASRLDVARERLKEALARLDVEDEAGASDQATVTLDQQSVGRLSRMDALQRQAMAQATGRRRDVQRVRILAAIQRLNEGEYGYCTECGDAIPDARLVLDPAVPTCVSCAGG